MRLLIDDFRIFGGDRIDVIAKTFDSGLEILRNLKVTSLYIDHDLGDRDPIRNGHKLLQIAIHESRLPPMVCVVTDNPVGRHNMEFELEHGAEFVPRMIDTLKWWCET